MSNATFLSDSSTATSGLPNGFGNFAFNLGTVLLELQVIFVALRIFTKAFVARSLAWNDRRWKLTLLSHPY